MITIIAAALLLAWAPVDGAPSNCGQTYQNLLQNLKTLKESCDVAVFKDCCQIKQLFPPACSGTYQVSSPCSSPFVTSKSYAHCDMTTDGGKWTLIQRRINGSVDFYRNWTDYVDGFGDLDGEFWYGLDNIHCLTSNEDVELRIELGNGIQPSIVWTYQLFRVGGPDTNYSLTIGQGHGEGSSFDAMAHHNGRPFSTRDRDNDAWERSCAAVFGGAWWHGHCFHANLNSGYDLHTPEDGSVATPPGTNRLVWYTSGTEFSHFTKVQMKIRPKRCTSASTCD